VSIGTRLRSIELMVQVPSPTNFSDPDFKGTPSFDVEWLSNDKRQRYGYSEITHSLLKGVISNNLQWPCVT